MVIFTIRNGPGNDVWITTELPEQGYCGLMVWKAGGVGLNDEAQYRIWIEPGLTDVEPDVPPLPVTALASVHPNPFNPHTTVCFDLAQDRRTRLAVHDLTGALVRTLVDADLPSGSHQAVWDGCRADGRAAASGVYLLLLEAGGVRDSRRVSLVR